MMPRQFSLRCLPLACLSLALSAGMIASAAAPQTVAPPAGFTSLFNGKDLSGWRGRQQDYSPYVESKLTRDELVAKQAQWNADMAMHWSVDAAKRELVSDGTGVFLATDRDYGDF